MEKKSSIIEKSPEIRYYQGNLKHIKFLSYIIIIMED